MAGPSVTYTFANSTTADATQVNQNFTDLINGLTDGTKDLSISALTCAGNATFNGNTTIGNASGDDLTITASLASSIAIKANNTYNIGSSTLGLASVYLGAAGGFTTRIVAAATSSYTITLPVAVPSAVKSVMTFNTSGTASFESRGVKSAVSKTTTYSAVAGDQVIYCSASGGAWTLSLPAASTVSEMVLTIKKTDSSTNAVTIDPNGSETIDGSTTRKLCTQYEWVTIQSDGTNWNVLGHGTISDWASYTMTIGGSTSAPTPGAGATKVSRWRRVGSDMEIQFNYSHSTGGSAGSGTYLFPLPTGYTIDTSLITVSTTATGNDGSIVGSGSGSNTTAADTNSSVDLDVVPWNSTNLALVMAHSANFQKARVNNANGPTNFDSTVVNLNFYAKVPITDWWG